MAGLDFLYEVSDDELEVLAGIIREKGGITNILKERSDYDTKNKYVKAVIDELLDFGGNTLLFQPDYAEVLKDVCKKMDVDIESDDSGEEMENKLLSKVASDLWDKMSEEGRRALLESMQESANFGKTGSMAMFAAIFRAGGFKSYQLSVIIANSIAKLILGRGLSLGLNAALTRALSYFAGPIGILMGIWTCIQILGPAYRVTVPAVTYVAALRKMTKEK